MGYKVLKVKLFQETAVYRNPTTMEVIETYPLPPPSTILGFIQRLLELDKPISKNTIDLSIQGTYDGLSRDYQLFKKFGSERRYPIIVTFLNNVRLLIHIKADNTFLEKIERALKSPVCFPHLGRSEDIVKIDSIKYTEVNKKEIETEYINNPGYIRADKFSTLEGSLKGISYRLPTFLTYENLNHSKEHVQIRNFIWGDYMYVESGELEEGIIEEDGDRDKVWWCMPNQILHKP